MVAATLTTGNLGAKAGANLDQCENGGTSTANPRPCTDTALAWANGNANEGNAHWYEGDSIPYRLRMSGLSTGSHSVTIKWDTTKSGKHALDYLTSYDRSYKPSETGEWNPCDASVTGSLCSPTSFSAWPIPKDTKTGLTADAAQPSVTGRWDQAFKLFGGTITGVSAYSYTVPDYSGDSSASITITFTASKSDAVLAWGGHIANHTDWPNRSAVDITGSPFRPHHRQHQRDPNADRYFDESMKSDLPCRTRPRYQQHDRQRNAPEAIRSQIRARYSAEQSQDEHAHTEYKRVRPEVTRHRRAKNGSEHRPDEALP